MYSEFKLLKIYVCLKKSFFLIPWFREESFRKKVINSERQTKGHLFVLWKIFCQMNNGFKDECDGMRFYL